MPKNGMSPLAHEMSAIRVITRALDKLNDSAAKQRVMNFVSQAVNDEAGKQHYLHWQAQAAPSQAPAST